MKRPLLSLLTGAAAVLIGTLTGYSYSSCETSCGSFAERMLSCPFSMDVRGDTGYESRLMFRGSKLAKEVATANIELSYPFEVVGHNFTGYGGAWGAFPVRNSENAGAQQINAFLGTLWHFDDMVTADVGYIRYNFTNTDMTADPLSRNFRNRNSSHHNELYFGATFDLVANPSLYVFYNFELCQWTIEPHVQHSFELFKYCRHSITLDLDLKAGWVHAKTFNGRQRPNGVAGQKNSYFYAKLQADITMHLSENASLSFGPRYGVNNDGGVKGVDANGAFTANALDGDCDTPWWGAHLKFGF